ncbi:MAG: hypothetical protein PUC33_07740 [Oscillospiraceae bacterium]|nr:hypothetical protein [Oscillospiraceae bacterium]MDD6146789.1 hypothetical protein [Oscillospiraceae bacterium]
MTRYLPAKLVAFLMSLYVFFAGIPYGDEPVKIDFNIKPDAYVYEAGDHYSVEIEWTNVGRPFIGTKSSHTGPTVWIYKNVDGELTYVPTITSDVTNDDAAVEYIVKHGYTETQWDGGRFYDDMEPGVYTIIVRFYDCSKTFEDIITIK